MRKILIPLAVGILASISMVAVSPAVDQAFPKDDGYEKVLYETVTLRETLDGSVKSSKKVVVLRKTKVFYSKEAALLATK